MTVCKVAGVLVALTAFGCNAQLPEVAPEAFSCDSDALAEDGLLQCPASHWCEEKSCTARMGCSAADADEAGCLTNVERCQLGAGGDVASVGCQRGLHTETSTAPDDLTACECPDGTYCVAYAEGVPHDPNAFPLFLLPNGGPLAAGAFGITGDRVGLRVCTRVCSGELDCPAGHTCRAAAVVQPALQSNPTSSRHTVGVCYPQTIRTITATTAEFPVLPEQPEPQACMSPSGCPVAGQICQQQVTEIPDHPSVPGGAAWPEGRFALVGRCVTNMVGLTPVGMGCTPDALCESGICHQMRCALLCDPLEHNACGGARQCLATRVSRARVGGEKRVWDTVWLCSDG